MQAALKQHGEKEVSILRKNVERLEQVVEDNRKRMEQIKNFNEGLKRRQRTDTEERVKRLEKETTEKKERLENAKKEREEQLKIDYIQKLHTVRKEFTQAEAELETERLFLVEVVNRENKEALAALSDAEKKRDERIKKECDDLYEKVRRENQQLEEEQRRKNLESLEILFKENAEQLAQASAKQEKVVNCTKRKAADQLQSPQRISAPECPVDTFNLRIVQPCILFSRCVLNR